MRERTAAALALLAAAGLLTATLVVGSWWTSHDEGAGGPPPASMAATAPPRSPTAAPTGTGAVPDRDSPEVARARAVPPAVEEHAPPVRLRMGGIELDAPVRPVGVRGDGEMELPARPWVLGWYRFGPAPGSGSGSVVVAGHLDSRRYGVGPLVALRRTSIGDRVQVTSADGSTSSYRVVRVERFDQEALPEELFARNGPERLRIITCGGGYDPATGYEENLVVTAVPGG